MRYWLVMPAAGSGSRFGADRPKQYAPLAGRTVIEWALAPFLADAPRCEHIVLALAREATGWEQVAARLNPRGTTTVNPFVGGAQRSKAVYFSFACLQRRADSHDW